MQSAAVELMSEEKPRYDISPNADQGVNPNEKKKKNELQASSFKLHVEITTG